MPLVWYPITNAFENRWFLLRQRVGKSDKKGNFIYQVARLEKDGKWYDENGKEKFINGAYTEFRTVSGR